MQEFDHIEIRGEGVLSHLAACDMVKGIAIPLRVTELSCRVIDDFKIEVLIGAMVYSRRKAFASKKDAEAFRDSVISMAHKVNRLKLGVADSL